MDIMRERALRLDGLVEYRRQECDGVDFAAILEIDPDDIDAKETTDEVIPDFVAGLLRDPDDVYTPPPARAPHMPHTQQPIPQPQIYFLNAVPVSPMPLPLVFRSSMMFRVA